MTVLSDYKSFEAIALIPSLNGDRITQIQLSDKKLQKRGPNAVFNLDNYYMYAWDVLDRYG